MKKVWRQLRESVVALLRQGLSPNRLATVIALSVAIGVMPVLGVPTPLLTVVVLAARLNLPLAQLVNYLCAPAQWALMVPCLRLGEWLTGAPPLALAPAEIVARVRAAPLEFGREFAGAAGHAALGWLILGPLLFAAVFAATRALLRRRATS